MRPLYKLTLLGLLSGILFYPPILLLSLFMAPLLVSSSTVIDSIIALCFAIPGIFFGYVIGSYFKKNHALFIILSGVAASLAILINPILYKITVNQYLATFLAAAIGTSIMLVGFSKKLLRLTPTQFLILAFFGGILGLSYELWFSPEFQIYHSVYINYILPIIWPTAMAAALGYCVEQNEKKPPKKTKAK